MREIKFRAWDTDNQRFIWTGFENFLSETHEDRPQDTRQGRMILNAVFSGMGSRCIFQQYVGLKDNNGKEIYEGDIVESPFTGDPVSVVWSETFAQFTFGGAEFNVEAKPSNIEVIGNIYENPELCN